MYITINGETYPGAKRAKGGQSVSYSAESLPEGLVAEGIIGVYRNDGFLLCEDDAGEYLRQESYKGMLTLTNVPEPETVEPVEIPDVWDELAAALREGVDEA